MKVVCIKNKYNKYELLLTLGKVYDVIHTNTNNKPAYYLIRDDSNKLVYYNIDCFISIQKHRDKQINSIINDI